MAKSKSKQKLKAEFDRLVKIKAKQIADQKIKDKERQLRRDIIKLKKEVAQDFISVSRRGISRTVKDPDLKKKILFAKKTIKGTFKAIQKFANKHG